MHYWHPTRCVLQLDFARGSSSGGPLSPGDVYSGTSILHYTRRRGHPPVPLPSGLDGLHFHAVTSALPNVPVAQPLAMQSMKVHQPGVGQLKVLKVAEDGTDGAKVLLFHTPDAITLDTIVTLTIQFTAHVQRWNVGGVYTNDRTNTTPATRGVLLTHFEVSLARLAFPCPDDPRYRLPWHLQSLQLPACYTTLTSTCALVCSKPLGTRGVQHTFAEGGPLPAYLMAFAAFSVQIEEVEETLVLRDGETVPLRVMTAAESGVSMEMMKRVAAVAQEAVRLLEDFFDAPLPLQLPGLEIGEPVPQLTIVVAPTMPYISGMEHHGCIFLNESIYRTKRQVSSSASKKSSGGNEETNRVELIVHELAHHWVGNALGMPFVLKEGVCQVLEQCLGDVILGKPMRKFKSFIDSSEHDVVDAEEGKEFTGHSYQTALRTLRQVVSQVGFAGFKERMRRMYRSEVLHFGSEEEMEEAWTAGTREACSSFLAPYVTTEEFLAHMEA